MEQEKTKRAPHVFTEKAFIVGGKTSTVFMAFRASTVKKFAVEEITESLQEEVDAKIAAIREEYRVKRDALLATIAVTELSVAEAIELAHNERVILTGAEPVFVDPVKVAVEVELAEELATDDEAITESAEPTAEPAAEEEQDF